MPRVVVSASFDDLRSGDIRLLEECGRLGEVHVWLWSDEAVRSLTGRDPKFPEAERLYVVQAIRHVSHVRLGQGRLDPDALPKCGVPGPDVWAVAASSDTPAKRAYCRSHGLDYRVLADQDLAGFPAPEPRLPAPGRKKVLVTGCFDWVHSGHVRFFEEVSELGDLYVVVGHDDNIRRLKGDGHPLFRQEERRYVVGSMRHVTQALISSGHGWLDAEPEIASVRPDVYAVNEDGDKPEKRLFCRERGLEYVVLSRRPKKGLQPRTSTHLRGF
jgi:cytidyltransferase-like protein